MVSIGIEQNLLPTFNKRQPNEPTLLRDSALWFPDIPKSHLQLNEAHFKSPNNVASGFRPLCCVFGDAANPGSLSKVFVTSDIDSVRIIDCHYDTGDVQTLGPADYNSDKSQIANYLVEHTAGKSSDTITFLKQKDPNPPEVSNYPTCSFSDDLKESHA